LPGTSILAEQALIFMNAKMKLPVKDVWWDSLIAKLRASPATIQDESALDALSKCAHEQGCELPTQRLLDAYLAAVSHPDPSARLLAMYANFAWNTLGDPKLALAVQRQAVDRDPRESAYRIGLTRMALRAGDVGTARQQVAAIQAMNVAGRFDDDLTGLQSAIDQARASPASSKSIDDQ
jgi:hypothetical protein